MQSAQIINQTPDLLAHYQPARGVYDELRDKNGQVRAHWQPLVNGLRNLSPADTEQARANSRRLLLENDVTYLPQGQQSPARPWELDLLPFVLQNEEFESLQQGLEQRTRLLNAIISDCLGPQNLLSGGLIPPGILHGFGGFLPACHGVRPPNDTFLYLVGYDLARGPDGRWWVVRDRVSSPSGLGYSLENRIVTSQCLPDLFENNQVQRIAGFFRAFNEALLSQSRQDDPLSLVLSTQQRGADYFEHTFLGRYLGHNVVSGADLTVRDERLYLKTIHGLRPVDLLMRRIDTHNIDPLELRVNSHDGVPGLLQSVRGGHVVMANWPGAEVAENPALGSFLPSLCRHLLGEELLTPSIASWWCGQPEEFNYVMDNLPQLIVRRIDSAGTWASNQTNHYLGAAMSASELDELRTLIKNHPHEFVGQEAMKVSASPVWNEQGQIAAAKTSVRLYLTATLEGGYQMMPGGLARAELPGANGAGAMRLPNDLNKDIWVANDQHLRTPSAASLLSRAPTLLRSDRNLPSRTADNLFWLGAYLERAESATRLFRSLFQHLSGEAALGQQVAALDRLAALLVAQGHMSARSSKRLLALGSSSFVTELSTTIFDPDGDDNLTRVLGNIERLSDLVRERLSPDMWRLLERLTQLPAKYANRPTRNLLVALSILNDMIDNLAAINGMISLNMTRANGWRFLDSGRRIERIRQTARLFRELALKPDAFEAGSLNLLLELSDCTITYRNRYSAQPTFELAADLLLADDSHPRSMLSQVLELRELMAGMPEVDPEGLPGPATKALFRMESPLRQLDTAHLKASRGRSGARPAVAKLTQQFEKDANLIISRLTVCYFSHASESRITGLNVSQ